MPELMQLIDELPSNRDPLFEKKIARFADDWCDPNKLAGILEDEAQSLERRFKAYYVLQTKSWRTEQHQEFHDRVMEFRSEFRSVDIWPHQETMAKWALAEDHRSRVTALSMAIATSDQLLNTPGAQHLVAEIAATIGENSSLDIETGEDGTLAIAHQCINRAIAKDPEMAKYHFTRARILALENRFDEARESLSKAASLETQRNKIPTLYNGLRLRITTAEHLHGLRFEVRESPEVRERDQ